MSFLLVVKFVVLPVATAPLVLVVGVEQAVARETGSEARMASAGPDLLAVGRAAMAGAVEQTGAAIEAEAQPRLRPGVWASAVLLAGHHAGSASQTAAQLAAEAGVTVQGSGLVAPQAAVVEAAVVASWAEAVQPALVAAVEMGVVGPFAAVENYCLGAVGLAEVPWFAWAQIAMAAAQEQSLAAMAEVPA